MRFEGKGRRAHKEMRIAKMLGRGPFQSLRARVNADVRELIRDNKVLHRARYRWHRRLLKKIIVDYPTKALPIIYLFTIATAALVASITHRLFPTLSYHKTDFNFLNDVAGYLLSAQIGILAVLTVAISG
ncbi:MAG: hypothetical protein KGI51_12550, partial [Rhodospirillales bacterium]|nr:hypothetical protein [Rhodospirillales bacterium]